jgi:hypothetical protein
VTTEPAPAGWYPDPLGAAPERYWDGDGWSDHIRGQRPETPASRRRKQTGWIVGGTVVALIAIVVLVKLPGSKPAGRDPYSGAWVTAEGATTISQTAYDVINSGAWLFALAGVAAVGIGLLRPSQASKTGPLITPRGEGRPTDEVSATQVSGERIDEAGSLLKPGGRTADPRNNGLATFGWITVFLFPIAGIAIGAVLANRDDKRGNQILFAAIAIQVLIIVGGVLLLQSTQHTTPNYEPY